MSLLSCQKFKNHADTGQESVNEFQIIVRWVGLSFSETADLLGISHTTVSKVCTVSCFKKQKTLSEPQFFRWEHLAGVRGKQPARKDSVT